MERVSYFYLLTPVVIVVGTAVLLTIPYLALIALMLVVLAALAALVWAIVRVPYKLGRAIVHRWERRGDASPQTAATLSPAGAAGANR